MFLPKGERHQYRVFLCFFGNAYGSVWWSRRVFSLWGRHRAKVRLVEVCRCYRSTSTRVPVHACQAVEWVVSCGWVSQATTYKNIDNFRRQLKMLGFSYDWEREMATTGETIDTVKATDVWGLGLGYGQDHTVIQ